MVHFFSGYLLLRSNTSFLFRGGDGSQISLSFTSTSPSLCLRLTFSRPFKETKTKTAAGQPEDVSAASLKAEKQLELKVSSIRPSSVSIMITCGRAGNATWHGACPLSEGKPEVLFHPLILCRNNHLIMESCERLPTYGERLTTVPSPEANLKNTKLQTSLTTDFIFTFITRKNNQRQEECFTVS